MLLEHTNIVTLDNGPRPAGKPDQCFYCGQPLGAKHKVDCVRCVKVVMVEVTMTIPRVVPASWSAGSVDFHLNESSWCADSIDRDLTSYMEAKGDDAPCMCGTFHGKFLRDATEEDLQGVDVVQLAAGRYGPNAQAQATRLERGVEPLVDREEDPARPPLSEGALMGVYMEFDHHADKAWPPAEYLLRFAAAVQRAVLAAERERREA